MTEREFKLPDLGEGTTEGELVSWLVAEGDAVTEDQPIAEVETDKALVEVPSPFDGEIAELRAEEGDVVPVGTVIVTFDVADDAAAADAAPEPADEGSEAAAEPEADAAPEPESGTTTEPDAGGPPPAAPPSVRRLARERGVDIAAVEGSGPGGRVTAADVESAAGDGPGTEGGEPTTATAEPAAETAEPAAETAEPAAEPTIESPSRERTLAAPATRKLAADLGVDIDEVPAVEERDGEAFVTPEAVRAYADERTEAEAAPRGGAPPGTAGVAEDEGAERVPYRGVRRTIGERMVESKFTAPHVTHHDVADVTELAAWREDLKDRAAERDAKLTYMPFVLKALVAALREFPDLNAELDEEAGEVVRKHHYDVGVAVATDAGLMVPVVADVPSKGLLELADEVQRLAAEARERTIAREDLQGSTVSVTNFGAIGGEYATPIINYPETAILGLGAIRERPAVVDGEVVPRTTLPLSVSIDHRVVDGAVAASFVNRLKEFLEDPRLLLLE